MEGGGAKEEEQSSEEDYAVKDEKKEEEEPEGEGDELEAGGDQVPDMYHDVYVSR